jgi:D-glycero-D-manno-heptose 1,7-bisphosphate phosphatase
MVSGMTPQPTARAVFLDRDGTLMEEVHYCRDPALVSLLPGVMEGLQELKLRGYLTVIVTNQSGIGRGRIALEEYQAVQKRLLELLGEGLIDATYYCADAPGGETPRRKPNSGMVEEAAREYAIDLAQSWLVGDRSSDVGCAMAAGVRPILVQTGYGASEKVDKTTLVAKDFASAVEFILKQ